VPSPIVALDAVPVGGGVIVAEHGLVVTRPVEGDLLAFSSLCPHAGCQVRAVAAGTISCFCHGSRFRIGDGSVVGGPSAQPLTPVPVTVLDGMVVHAAG
jgi:nitrite reductase/ring-hydroxylating ferredoxin subunit